MTTLPFKASGNTNPFDEMFLQTHGGSTEEDEDGEVIWDGDIDECVEPDSMNDKDEN